MKTFLVIASFPDSLIKFRGPLLQALVRKGVHVHVAAPALSEVQGIRHALSAMNVSAHDISLRRTGTNPLADIRTFVELCSLIYRIKPDYVLSYTVKPVIYGTIAAWLQRVPRRFALITGLGYAFTGSAGVKRLVLRRVIQRLYRFGLSKAEKVFFQNPDDEALFRNQGLLTKRVSSCVVNGSGVSLEDYVVAELPSKLSFLLIARLLGDKGVREYAQAAREVKKRYPEISFRLVGWIDDNPDAIEQHELDEWVSSGTLEFLGKLDDVRPAVANCSVYVLPSYREGTPRTVLEAMAMGRPVITTDAPGCRETVIEGVNGFLVPVQCASELAGAMMRFIDEPNLISRMGDKSRLIAEEKYDVNKVNDVMLKEMGVV